MNKVEDRCPYCDTSFAVEFDSEDDILLHCPCCGEELPEWDEEEIPYDEDEWN